MAEVGPAALFTLSEEIGLELARLRREYEVREQFPGRLPAETAHTAGVFGSRWSDAELKAVHDAEARRFDQLELTRLLAEPRGSDGAMARRVALRNPRHALGAASSGRGLHEALVGLSAVRRRDAHAQNAHDVRGLLPRDEPSLEASVTGRARSRLHGPSSIASARSHSLGGRPSTGARARAPRRTMRAPASPPGSSRVVLQSATRLLLGEGQLSSVSIPSKLHMGSTGPASIDYLEEERRVHTSPPKSHGAIARRSGGFDRLETNFDVLPAHKYWAQEQQEHWRAVNAQTAATSGPQPRQPAGGAKPAWLRLADSKAPKQLLAQIEGTGGFLPALRALELGAKAKADAYPHISAVSVPPRVAPQSSAEAVRGCGPPSGLLAPRTAGGETVASVAQAANAPQRVAPPSAHAAGGASPVPPSAGDGDAAGSTDADATSCTASPLLPPAHDGAAATTAERALLHDAPCTNGAIVDERQARLEPSAYDAASWASAASSATAHAAPGREAHEAGAAQHGAGGAQPAPVGGQLLSQSRLFSQSLAPAPARVAGAARADVNAATSASSAQPPASHSTVASALHARAPGGAERSARGGGAKSAAALGSGVRALMSALPAAQWLGGAPHKGGAEAPARACAAGISRALSAASMLPRTHAGCGAHASGAARCAPLGDAPAHVLAAASGEHSGAARADTVKLAAGRAIAPTRAAAAAARGVSSISSSGRPLDGGCLMCLAAPAARAGACASATVGAACARRVSASDEALEQMRAEQRAANSERWQSRGLLQLQPDEGTVGVARSARPAVLHARSGCHVHCGGAALAEQSAPPAFMRQAPSPNAAGVAQPPPSPAVSSVRGAQLSGWNHEQRGEGGADGLACSE